MVRLHSTLSGATTAVVVVAVLGQLVVGSAIVLWALLDYLPLQVVIGRFA